MRRPTMAHTVRPEKTFFFRSSTPSPPFDKKLIPSNCFPKKKKTIVNFHFQGPETP
jgi:hypothetical protein